MDHPIYAAQDRFLEFVFDHEKELKIDGVLFCGGTALSRCYLNHRISYDLDFFIPNDFSADLIENKATSYGFKFIEADKEKVEEPTDRPRFVEHAKFMVEINGLHLKVDFVGDVFQGMFDEKMVNLNGATVRTEVLDGLYHRKLRAMSGAYNKEGSAIGSRQTVRDIFDLFVLNSKVKSVSDFISDMNDHGANIPEKGFVSNIYSMPWIDFIDDFELLEKADEFSTLSLKDIKMAIDEECIKINENDNQSTLRL